MRPDRYGSEQQWRQQANAPSGYSGPIQADMGYLLEWGSNTDGSGGQLLLPGFSAFPPTPILSYSCGPTNSSNHINQTFVDLVTASGRLRATVVASDDGDKPYTLLYPSAYNTCHRPVPSGWGNLQADTRGSHARASCLPLSHFAIPFVQRTLSALHRAAKPKTAFLPLAPANCGVCGRDLSLVLAQTPLPPPFCGSPTTT